MHKAIAGLAVVFAIALVAGPVRAESGVLTLQGGESSVVATMTLGKGDVVEWTYSAPGGIEFTIARDGTEVYSTSTLVGTGTYTAQEAGTHTFTFRNPGSNMSLVSYDLKKRFDWTPVLIGAGVVTAAGVGIGGALWARSRRKAPAAPQAWTAQAPPPPPQ